MQFTYVNAKDPKQVVYRSKITSNASQPLVERKTSIKVEAEGKIYIEYKDDQTLSDIKLNKGFKLEYKFPSDDLFCLEVGFSETIVSIKPFYLKQPKPFEQRYFSEIKEIE